MFGHRRRAVVLALGLAVAGASMPAAQGRRPDFSGAWQEDLEASKALTEQKGLVWRVAGAGAGGAATRAPGTRVLMPITTITQSAAELVLERRLEGEFVSRTVLKLDGSVSVNTTTSSTTRSTSVWKGASLVTTGTTHVEMDDREITRETVTTRTLMPDGTMQVEARTVQGGQARVSWLVLRRMKP